MSKIPRFQPKRTGAQRCVLFVLFPGFQILDVAGPLAAFEIATRFARCAYTLKLAASKGGGVASSAGVTMQAEALKGIRFAGIDTLVMVGGVGTSMAMQDAALLSAIQRAHKHTRRTTSVCSGSFV